MRRPSAIGHLKLDQRVRQRDSGRRDSKPNRTRLGHARLARTLCATNRATATLGRREAAAQLRLQTHTNHTAATVEDVAGISANRIEDMMVVPKLARIARIRPVTLRTSGTLFSIEPQAFQRQLVATLSLQRVDLITPFAMLD